MRERKGGAQYLCFLFATFIVSSSEVPLGRRRAAGEPAPRGERTAAQLSAPAPTQREPAVSTAMLSGPFPFVPYVRTAIRVRGVAATLRGDLLPVCVLPSGLVKETSRTVFGMRKGRACGGQHPAICCPRVEPFVGALHRDYRSERSFLGFTDWRRFVAPSVSIKRLVYGENSHRGGGLSGRCGQQSCVRGK